MTMTAQASRVGNAQDEPPPSKPSSRHSTYEALSELVDNSIDARSKGGVDIQIKLDYAAKTIQVRDDGVGMSPGELRNAMAAVGETPSAPRAPGATGLGMREACSLLGRSFSVVTSKAGSTQEHVAEYDEGRREQGGTPDRPPLLFAARKKDDPAEHGTRILVTALKVPLYAEQTTLFKKRLGERHCDYIGEGRATIRINSVECSPVYPNIADWSVRHFELKVRSGKADGWIGLMKRRPATGNRGINLYHRGRLVQMHSRFGMRDNPSVAKMVGRVSLDRAPMNRRGTGFEEDTAEYLEAERAFKEHPAVAETMRNYGHSAGAGDADFEHLYDYLLGRRDDPVKIDPRPGRLASKALLDSMPSLKTFVGGRAVTVEYADAGGPPYERREEAEGGGVRYVINKASPVFGVVKSPLYVVALAVADLRAASAAALGASPPAADAHAVWASMVDGLASGKAAGAEAASPPANGYSLSRSLTKLLSVLKNCYFDKFEFTGLSTLALYTHNALASPVYSLYTEREHGEYLCDVIMDYTTGYVPLFNPDGREIDMWRYASGDKRLVGVREYSAGELSGPVAPPAKAWMDLVREVRLHHMPYMEEDLVSILEKLKHRNMLALRDLDIIARRRKSRHARDLIEQVFAA